MKSLYVAVTLPFVEHEQKTEELTLMRTQRAGWMV